MLAGVAIGLRSFQFLFAIVVLGLAATLINAQVYGSAPITTKYSSFTGGFGILVAIAGAIGLFVDRVPDLANIVLDGLSALLFLAGGIAWAIGLKSISCTEFSSDNIKNMLGKGLINLGIDERTQQVGVADLRKSDEENWANMKSVCTKGFTDEIMQFVAFALGVTLLGVGWVRMRRGGKVGGTYV